MLSLVKDNYRTYYNTRDSVAERHWLRLLCTVTLALGIGILSSSSNIFGMMINGLAILAGFTFTALFSDHSLADVGLPKPKNENDVFDLKILSTLANNFHTRAKYFIFLAIVDVCLLVAISAGFAIPALISENFTVFVTYIYELGGIGWTLSHSAKTYTFFVNVTYAICSSISLFIFLECLYTFYRLSETIIAIVNARREYLRT
ncbi:hypothetical protein AMC83_CH00369 [Rhizobium phaseoli]|nr:hypothetical protein AMC83_CH00369 [Rhizobium phaseoli]